MSAVLESGMHGGAPDTAFTWPVRVYWEDTDAGGVVFYANYLKFFERARTEWLRSLGLGQQAMRETTGAIFIVSETSLRYLAPARLDDLLHVTVQPLTTGRASMVLQQQAWKLVERQAGNMAGEQCPPAQLLCEGRIRIGCVDAHSFKPRRFPAQLSETLSA